MIYSSVSLEVQNVMTSVVCLRGPPRPIQRGCWPPRVLRWLRWLAPFSLHAPTRRPDLRAAGWAAGAVLRAARARAAGAEAEEPHGAAWRGGGGAGAAGRARDDGGGLELSRSLSSVRRQGLELRVACAMAELAQAGTGRAQVVAEEQGPPRRALQRRRSRAPPLTAPAPPSPHLLPPRRRRIGGVGARLSSPRLRAPQALRR